MIQHSSRRSEPLVHFSRRQFLPAFTAATILNTVVARPIAAAGGGSFDPIKLRQIRALFESTVNRGEIAGISYLVMRHGRTECEETIGYADVATGEPLAADSIFRIYSMTKPITAVALMTLYEEGRFGLDDPLSQYIPSFANPRVLRSPGVAIGDTIPANREPTIHDLFRHTAGFTHGFSPSTSGTDRAYIDENLFDLELPLEEMVDRLSRIPLSYQPGTKFEYSIAPDVQARLVEILSGQSFERFLQDRLFEPLGMKDTGFWALKEKSSRLVPVNLLDDGRLRPCKGPQTCPAPADFLHQRENLNSYTTRHQHMGGSYGLVSTVHDYARFAQMMLNEGVLENKRIIGGRTVRYMTQNHLGPVVIPARDGWPSGTGWGLGFALVENPAELGEMASPGTFYWGGVAGTTFWVDPTEDLVVVAMTQHMDVPAVGRAFSALKSMIYGALAN